MVFLDFPVLLQRINHLVSKTWRKFTFVRVGGWRGGFIALYKIVKYQIQIYIKHYSSNNKHPCSHYLRNLFVSTLKATFVHLWNCIALLDPRGDTTTVLAPGVIILWVLVFFSCVHAYYLCISKEHAWLCWFLDLVQMELHQFADLSYFVYRSIQVVRSCSTYFLLSSTCSNSVSIRQ